jgi:hypothetical protein
VQAQVLKLISAKPDAVFVGASGTPAAMPQITLRERGFKGRIYQSHGVTSKEFLRVGGKNVEGALIPVGPVLVAEQLPDSHPTKKNAWPSCRPSRPSTAGFPLHLRRRHLGCLAAAAERHRRRPEGQGQAGTPEFRAAAARRHREDQQAGGHQRRVTAWRPATTPATTPAPS